MYGPSESIDEVLEELASGILRPDFQDHGGARHMVTRTLRSTVCKRF